MKTFLFPSPRNSIKFLYRNFSSSHPFTVGDFSLADSTYFFRGGKADYSSQRAEGIETFFPFFFLLFLLQ